jgi:hypothetical protein
VIILIGSTQYKDKFEKKIVSTYEPSKLHFARALLTPLVYLAFTVSMIYEGSIASFLLATLYQVGYIAFYYDEAMMQIK